MVGIIRQRSNYSSRSPCYRRTKATQRHFRHYIIIYATLYCTLYRKLTLNIENLHLVDLGFNQILSTFKFTNNGLSIPPGTCTHTYQVETNAEELTAKQYYSMRCAEQRSKEKCLKIDIYNQKADDFSIPDKISDCTWQDAIYTQ